LSALSGDGGTSSTLSQNTDSRSVGSCAPEKIRRSAWLRPGSTRAIGGVSTNGASLVSAVWLASPLSIQACTSAGDSPTLSTCTVTSRACAG